MQPHGLISNTALWLWQTLCSGDNDWAKSGRKIIETRNKRKKGHGHHMHPFRPRLACVECVFTTSRCNGHLRLPAFRVPGRERTGNRSAFTNKPKKKRKKKRGVPNIYVYGHAIWVRVVMRDNPAKEGSWNSIATQEHELGIPTIAILV